MGVDEGHSICVGIAAQHARLAQCECLQVRKEFIIDVAGHVGQPLRLRVERGMNIEAGAPAGARHAAFGKCRVGVGHKNNAPEIADQRLQRLSQSAEALWQFPRQCCARIV